MTRNLGMQYAKGEYIHHCDSDDWLDMGALKYLYDSDEKSGADIILFGYKILVKREDYFANIVDVYFCKIDVIGQLIVDCYLPENIDNYFIVQSAWNRIAKEKIYI